jgi:hypothetical protein
LDEPPTRDTVEGVMTTLASVGAAGFGEGVGVGSFAGVIRI